MHYSGQEALREQKMRFFGNFVAYTKFLDTFAPTAHSMGSGGLAVFAGLFLEDYLDRCEVGIWRIGGF